MKYLRKLMILVFGCALLSLAMTSAVAKQPSSTTLKSKKSKKGCTFKGKAYKHGAYRCAFGGYGASGSLWRCQKGKWINKGGVQANDPRCKG